MQKAPHSFFLPRRVTEAGSPLTAPGLEREEATGLSHLPSIATKTQLWKEGALGTACWRKARSQTFTFPPPAGEGIEKTWKQVSVY